MVRLETTFAAVDRISPEFAAKLSQHAERFKAQLSVECGGKRLSLDSLICILSLELYRGVKVAVVAEGEDEEQAAAEILRVMQGEN